jgi:hypothetical protein
VSGAPGLGGPDFLVVGSARSGTTLVQRLACELPGVAMPPETHFFDVFVPGLLRRGPLPLHGRRLADELEEWLRMEQVRGIEVDVDAVVGELGGHCDSLAQLFDVLVRHLVPPAERYGEKTPKHLLWWRPLTEARSSMQVVAVVRDPRSVVSSNLASPWAAGISDWDWGEDLYVAMAERWRVEQEQVLLMAQVLGSRCLVLRYEDVVAGPATARSAIARLIDVDDRAAPADRRSSPIVLPWETWKADAGGGGVGSCPRSALPSWLASGTTGPRAGVSATAWWPRRSVPSLSGDAVPTAGNSWMRSGGSTG